MGPRVASLAAANVKPAQGMQDDHAVTRTRDLWPLVLGSWAMPSHSLE